MGRAISLVLAMEGAKLVCRDLRELPNSEGYEADIKQATQDLIINKGGEAIFQLVDISIPSQIETADAKAIEKFGRLDILINCAGYWAPFREFVDEDDGLRGKGCSGREMGESGSGSHSEHPLLCWTYCICRRGCLFGNQSFYYSYDPAGVIDHAKDSININCVAPGAVQTGMARANFENADIIKIMRNATPWRRTGFAEDIAGAVMLFCLPQSLWVPGHLLAVDGGMTLGVPAPS
ncbi:putative oxidoreductase [Lachnellula subtilissima]|uniref:Putative oxidoreductase n=1 Tax=Lachnellula subtilissima TaxID=602034 RepID=A0A8H8U6N3_9HELO|nr:putative oxidoreductase [Lachnellula subtilissima]